MAMPAPTLSGAKHYLAEEIMLSGLKILIIGSSHLATPGYLITSLHDTLQAQGAQVHSIGVCGVTSSAWLQESHGDCGGAERIGKGPLKISVGSAAKTTPITQLVAKEQPQLVLIVMGDTLGGYAEPFFNKQWASQEVHKLTGALAQTGTRCAWVGPAWGEDGGVLGKTNARVKLVSDFLAVNVEPCIWLNSLAMSKPGAWHTTDGQHFTPSGYKAWGDAIARELARTIGPTTRQR
jgi:hypothetical protein